MKVWKKLGGLMVMGVLLFSLIVFATNSKDLSDYPSPLLIKDTTFDGEIVYGADADPSDIMGLVDAVAAISVIEVEVEIENGGNITIVEGESTKIETSKDKLNIRDTLSSVIRKLDVEDLPDLLADGTYENDNGKEFDYEQTIEFSDNPKLTLYAQENDDNEEIPTLGIKNDEDSLFLTYVLDFSSDAEGGTNGEDFEDTTIVLLGKEYDIVKAESDSLTLMAGSLTKILEQGDDETFQLNGKDYKIEVTWIGETSGESRVKFKINGVMTNSLVETDTYKIDEGVMLGVREILEEEAGEVNPDMVEFWLGAEKLYLKDGDELEVNDEEIDDILVDIVYDTTNVENIEEIQLEWTPDEDDIKITDDEDVVMPGIGAFKFIWDGLTTDNKDVVEIEANDDETLEMTVRLEDGEATFDLLRKNDGNATWDIIGGDEVLHTSIDNTQTNMLENEMFVISNLALDKEESHIIEITDVDQGSIINLSIDKVCFEDISNGDEKCDLAGETIEFGDISFIWDCTVLGIIDITMDDAVNNVGDRLYTKEAMEILLPVDGVDIILGADITYDIIFTEKDGLTFDVTLDAGLSNEEVEVSDTSLTGCVENEKTKIKVCYVPSDISSKIELTTDKDQDKITITHYGDDSYGNLYVTGMETTFTKTSGEVKKELKRVDIPLAISDEEALAKDSNMDNTNYLLVGGPCANDATAKVLGVVTSWPECAEGFKEGIGRIILKEMSADNVAIVVAGYTALDTTRATRVLEGYLDRYTLSGTEIEVVGTSKEPKNVNVVKNGE